MRVGGKSYVNSSYVFTICMYNNRIEEMTQLFGTSIF